MEEKEDKEDEQSYCSETISYLLHEAFCTQCHP